MAHPLLERLSRGLILSDGAMGTMLYNRGVSFEHCFEELNRSNPSLVQDIHLAYIRAGSELIETNTFGANRVRLASYGMEAKVGEFTLWGAKTAKYARDISGEPVIIAGAIGPLGKPLRPVGKITREEARAIFREAAEGLLEGGVDCFMIETAYDLTEVTEAILAIQETTDLPIIAQMTFSEDGKTPRGHTVEDVVEGLSALDVAVIGANCSMGPQGTLDVIRRMHEITDLPLSVHPNAGMPRIIQDRYIYLSSPTYVAEYAVAFAEAGAQIIGGCCGMTPDHIAAMREALVKLRPPVESVAAAHRETIEVSGKEAFAPPSEARSHLAGLLEEDHFVVSVEVDPPKGTNPRKDIEGAAMLKAAGADLINVADSPMARVRMGCMAMAYLIQREVGIETIIHFTTRDRNLMGLQSDLLGAHAVGIRNILALTGDPPRIGDCQDATPVFDVDSVGLIHILRSLNEGKDLSDNSIGEPARFFIICAVNPADPDLDAEMGRFRKKIEAGAELAMTQPLYEIHTLLRFLERCEKIGLNIPILLGVLPLVSFRHASFLHNEVPGIEIPEVMRKRLQDAGDKARQAGVELATELLMEAVPLVKGTYLMPSFGRYEVVADIVKELRRS
ncbi:MAG: bifunctional homocysteine S-methyltransferase/methylenetetrahydrofolate reductase [bacterium]|nr:bifunctional homocysteine S-methyltransferase/methylenetetrahydrofolate reductase [bacterium]